MKRAPAGTPVRLATPVKVAGMTLPTGTTGVIVREINGRGPEAYDAIVHLDTPPEVKSLGPVDVGFAWSEIEPA